MLKVDRFDLRLSQQSRSINAACLSFIRSTLFNSWYLDMELLYMDADMYKAAAKGEIEIFTKSVDNLPFLFTPNKNTVLHINITAQTGRSGKPEESKEFVEKILDLCPSLLLQANIKGESLLHIAARHGLEAVVKTLLKRANSHDYDYRQELESGINATRHMVRMVTNQKETALHEAVRYCQVGVVELLTRADPDFPYFANEAGETPLYLAVERGYCELAFKILERCTSPAHGGPNGRKSLHVAVIFNDEEITRKLIETKGSLTTEADDQGWTPLHYAAHFGHTSVVKLLLHHDPSAAYIGDKDGKKTALHIAASRGYVGVIDEILSCCPDCCEQVDNRGWNIFHFALESNSDQAIKYILENSSLRNIINEKEAKESTTPLRWLALENGGKHLSAPDIILSDVKFSKIKNMEEDHTGPREQVIQKPSEEDHTGPGQPSEEEVIQEPSTTSNQERLKDVTGTQLIVATLIATVTFTAGFTMPGGLNSEEGPTQGAAILTGSKAFQAFAITNTMAMSLSTSSVAFHIFMERHNKDNKLDSFLVGRLYLNTCGALLYMVIAFMTSTYAVLEHSSAFGIGIAICIAGSFLFFLWPTLWTYRSLRFSNNDGLLLNLKSQLDNPSPSSGLQIIWKMLRTMLNLG